MRRTLPALALLLIAAAGAPALGQTPPPPIPAIVIAPHETPAEHPVPRLGVEMDQVLAPTSLPLDATGNARLAYMFAASIPPQILDGIHSYCKFGRSLLRCFETEAAVDSEITQRVVNLVLRLHRMGYDLEAIRTRLDAGPIEA